MADEMNEVRVAAILAAYGADPARWPDGERVAALAWTLAHREGLAEARADARAIDAALSRDQRGRADDAALRARVLAAIPRDGNIVTPFRARGPSGVSRNAGAIAALAACAVLGVMLGFNGARAGDDPTADADAAFGAAFGVTATPGGDG